MSLEPTTNFIRSDGLDLGRILITKDYLISVYPSIAQEIGKTPELWTWGRGNYGQLGNSSTTDISTPVTTFSGGTNWKQMSFVLQGAAIKTDGTLWTWGRGAFGILGNATTINASTPVTTFSGGTNWKQVDCGDAHIAAIKTDGTLWTWGSGANGRLGNSSTTDRSTPVTTFAGGTNWKQVNAGNQHTAAIKTDGTLWVWGNGLSGQLGNNNAVSITSTPVTTFTGGTNWKQVTTGVNHTAAIKTDGTLWTWGLGNYGQLGNTSTTNISTPITTFAGGTNWKQVDCGNGFSAAIKNDGTLWTWGQGTLGRLGNNNVNNVSTPITTFVGGNNWKQLSCGFQHAAAIKTDGTLWTWGSGSNGQLGINNTVQRTTPVTTFVGGNNWKQVECGSTCTAAIQSSDFI